MAALQRGQICVRFFFRSVLLRSKAPHLPFSRPQADSQSHHLCTNHIDIGIDYDCFEGQHVISNVSHFDGPFTCPSVPQDANRRVAPLDPTRHITFQWVLSANADERPIRRTPSIQQHNSENEANACPFMSTYTSWAMRNMLSASSIAPLTVSDWKSFMFACRCDRDWKSRA